MGVDQLDAEDLGGREGGGDLHGEGGRLGGFGGGLLVRRLLVVGGKGGVEGDTDVFC